MVATRLKLDAKDYIGRPDLHLCNGARISFVYGEAWIPASRRADYEEIPICSDVWLSEYIPPRISYFYMRSQTYMQSQSPKFDDLPF